MRLNSFSAGAVLALGFALVAPAPPVLQEYAVPADHGAQKIVLQVRDFAPGETVAWHTHRGAEIARLESGEMELITPGGVRLLRPGDSFQVARGVPHAGRNPGTVAARLVITLAVDRDGPLREPAQPPAP